MPTGTLQQGWYKLQETQAPQGYEIQGTGTYEFFLNAGEIKEITVGNSSGTHGTTIANVITNHNGVAVVTGLKAGGYIIEETY